MEGDYRLSAYFGNNPMAFRTEQHENTTTGHGGLTTVGLDLPHSSGTNDYVSGWAGYFAGSDLRDCTASTSCGHFDRFAAGRYGLTYGDEQNPPGYVYEDNGSDCTNFLSQALRAGGMRFANEYELRTDADEGSDGQSWWYLRNGTPLEHGKKRTASWVRAEALIDHLRHRRLVGAAFRRPSANNLRKVRARVGDIFAFDWFLEGNRYDHLAIVSEIGSDGEPRLAYHTHDERSMPWHEFVDKTEGPGGYGRYGEGWTFDRFRVVYTGFND
ncbi:MAG: amidase domain-containing protein [Solirubrobacterales bacterium]